MNILMIVFLAALGQALSADNNLSCDQIRIFVDGHNSRRLQLAQGKIPGQPGADNMGYMVWDEELATLAFNWASKHKFQHNPNRTLNSGRFGVGENIFWTASNNLAYKLDQKSVMPSWFDEYKNFKFGPLKQEDFESKIQIGHYTQMAWANSIYLGCAIAGDVKDGFQHYYVVCNYGPGGNYLGQTPYKASKTGNGKLFCYSKNCNQPYGKSCPK